MSDQVTSILDSALKVARDFGIFAVICIAFIWWGQEDKRELQHQRQLDQDFMREKLMVTLEKNTQVVEAAAHAMDALARRENQRDNK